MVSFANRLIPQRRVEHLRLCSLQILPQQALVSRYELSQVPFRTYCFNLFWQAGFIDVVLPLLSSDSGVVSIQSRAKLDIPSLEEEAVSGPHFDLWNL